MPARTASQPKYSPAWSAGTWRTGTPSPVATDSVAEVAGKAGPQQLGDHGRADEARGSRDEDAHDSYLRSIDPSDFRAIVQEVVWFKLRLLECPVKKS